MNAQTQYATEAAGATTVHTVREADRQPTTQPQTRWQMTTTYPGYERQRILTADLVVGQQINFPGAGMHLPIAEIRRDGDETVLIGVYEKWGHRRQAIVRRGTAGRSTILVEVGAA